MSHQLIIWGAAGHAAVLHEFLRERYTLLALVDRNEVQPPIPGVPVLQGREKFETWLLGRLPDSMFFSVAIGGEHGRDRIELARYLSSQGLRPIQAIHPTAVVAPTAMLAPNVHILAGSIVCAQAVIGDAVIVNSRALVEHQVRVGAGSHIGPGAIICGEVILGENVFIGAGSVILPKLHIGANTIVGAGSVVTRDVPDNMVVCGAPAKTLRKVNHEPS